MKSSEIKLLAAWIIILIASCFFNSCSEPQMMEDTPIEFRTIEVEVPFSSGLYKIEIKDTYTSNGQAVSLFYTDGYHETVTIPVSVKKSKGLYSYTFIYKYASYGKFKGMNIELRYDVSKELATISNGGLYNEQTKAKIY